MIKYQLRCEADHEFEGWFRNSGDFDVQAKKGFLACPVCGSAEIRKAIMAPAIAGAARGGARSEVRKLIAEAANRARDYVEKNYDYVGQRFPEEARKIHYGETSPRGIYGEASGKEVKDLLDEGVQVAPMPGKPQPAAIPAPTAPKQPAKKLLN